MAMRYTVSRRWLRPSAKTGPNRRFVTANGGVMSKQAVGVYTASQPHPAWDGDLAKGYQPTSVELDDAPYGKARILTYARPVTKDVMGAATLLVEMESGARAMAVLEGAADIDLGGMTVHVTPRRKAPQRIAHLIMSGSSKMLC